MSKPVSGLSELCNLINPHPTFYQGIVHLQGPETVVGHYRTYFCICTVSCVLNTFTLMHVTDQEVT